MMDNDLSTSPPVATRPPLRRPHSGRMVAGVAAGLAERLDVPVWLIRIAFILFTIPGGFGIVAYLAGWLLIPDEGEAEPIARHLIDRVDSPGSWIGVILIVIGALIVLDRITWFGGDLTGALILLVIGVLLYRGDFGRRTERAAASEEKEEKGEPSMTPVQPPKPADTNALAGEPTPVPAPPPPPPPPPRAPRPARPRSILGRLTIGLGFVVLGVMAFADSTMTTFDPTARHYVAVAVGIAGLGLLVGGWLGRARGLIVLGALLVPLLLVTPIAELDFDGPIGERRVDPQSVAAIDDSYELAIGQMILDLRDVDFAGQTVEFDAQVGIGSLQILLPPEVGVDVSTRVGLGEAQVLDRVRSGAAVRLSNDRTGDGLVVIDARVNIGQVEVISRALGGSGRVDRQIEVDRVADLQPNYELGTGELTLDLSGLTLETERTVSAGVGAGTLRVIVDDSDLVSVTAHVGVGDAEVFDERRSGLGLDIDREVEGALLTLDLSVDSGNLIVEEN